MKINIGEMVSYQGEKYTVKRITHSAVPGDIVLAHITNYQTTIKVPLKTLEKNKKKVMKELVKVWRPF